MKKINLGLLGFGTIGSGVLRVLRKKAALLENKLGLRISLKRVCEVNPVLVKKLRSKKVDVCNNADRILEDPQIDIVIELIGGIHPAKEYILKALRNKKHVVTANKALLAEEGEDIFKTAKENGVDVYFEASVGGGIPIIRSLREGLIANKIESIYGIINGTSNYILTRMSESGCDFKSALKEAQKRGYAEKNPHFDISGIDCAHKIAILARICFNQAVKFKDIYIEGINDIELSDLNYAQEFGFCIKLLAIAKKAKDGLQIRVHPCLVPKGHVLANVRSVYNAVFIKADLIGKALLQGEGAGQLPTASAVVGDVISISQKIGLESQMDFLKIKGSNLSKKILSMDQLNTRYYFRFTALDKPEVLSKISRILGKFKISIYSVIQKGRRQSQAVPIVMMTHEAREKDICKALAQINKLSFIKKKTVAIRVEGI
ncbi:MAG: homoserine dehydrogenase [Candidatus Omnitrophica bacterium]|nr:homoserine dehydrogenase [Candidatus Omnitrophota bacterium]